MTPAAAHLWVGKHTVIRVKVLMSLKLSGEKKWKSQTPTWKGEEKSPLI